MGIFLTAAVLFPVICAVIYGDILDEDAVDMEEEKKTSAQGAIILTVMAYCFFAGVVLLFMN